eukprot:scaffold880_cov132-Cylindrotheca_fusiformis.AAC.3
MNASLRRKHDLEGRLELFGTLWGMLCHLQVLFCRECIVSMLEPQWLVQAARNPTSSTFHEPIPHWSVFYTTKTQTKRATK